MVDELKEIDIKYMEQVLEKHKFMNDYIIAVGKTGLHFVSFDEKFVNTVVHLFNHTLLSWEESVGGNDVETACKDIRATLTLIQQHVKFVRVLFEDELSSELRV